MESFLKEVRKIYDEIGMRGIEELLEKYPVDSQERNYLGRIYDYLGKRNNSSPGIRFLGIDDSLIKIILDEVPFPSNS